MTTFKEKLPSVKAFIFDVDGVFTDGKIIILPDGSQARNMNVKDGYAVHFAIKKGYPIAIITGGKCESIRGRFSDLGVQDVYIESRNKMDDFNDFLSKRGIHADEVLYMGDDLPDYVVMKTVLVATCPADAAIEIKGISHYISDKNGGCGSVRDVIEQTLRVQGKWMDTDAFVW